MRIASKGIVFLAAAALLASAPPAHALRVATWNLLSYEPSNGGVTPRQPNFRTIMAGLLPDVLITQEIVTSAAKDSMLNNVLNVVEPGQWAAAWTDVNGEGMAVYWKPAKVAVTNVSAFSTSGPRKVLSCLVKPVGYLTNPGWFRLYSIHLKAGGPGTVDSTTRRLECTDIRNTLNSVNQGVVGTNFLIGGDTNFYGPWEGGYIRFTESQADNDGRCKDFLNLPDTWHENSSYAVHDTQSPCLVCPTIPGITFSGGGMDDRLDMLLSSYSVQDGQGLDVKSYAAYGNDGLHFNRDINASNYNGAVGIVIATALHDVSDHLPVVAVIQLPAKIAAASQLDFGTVIVGATAEQALAVSNIAPVPGDSLRYTLTAPAGFTAPSGTFAQAAGDAATNQTLGMSTASAGTPGGTLTLATNDPDTLSKSVKLSGTVLRHAVASLDSLAVVEAGTVDFGARVSSAFGDTTVKVYDQGYDALQARLAVSAGVISGGDGRFSFVGGFHDSLVAGTPAAYGIRFDTTGARLDSTYEATLTFSSADEPLPGAQPRADLVVTLRAHPTTDDSGVPGGLPTALRFYPPRPNPAPGPVAFAFDLPAAATIRLEVFDLSGRRVATVASGWTQAGRYQLRWSPRDAGVAAGLYFARFSAPGLTRVNRVVLLP